MRSFDYRGREIQVTEKEETSLERGMSLEDEMNGRVVPLTPIAGRIKSFGATILPDGGPHGPSKAWLKVKNPKSPAATRAADGTF